jgi:uncharacterized delta-60 repeat protein
LIGGQFSSVNGQTSGGISRLNPDGTSDTSLGITTNGVVGRILIQRDGKVIISGNFNNVNGQPRSGIARYNADGTTIDAGFAPFFSQTAPGTMFISNIHLLQNGKIMAGGIFDNVSGTAKQNVVRLNADGTVDTAFTATANNTTTAFAEESTGRILIGGQFSTFNGVARSGLVRVGEASGQLDMTFVPSLNTFIDNILIQADGKILLGGSFSTVSGVSRNGIARIATTDVALYDLARSGSSVIWSGFFQGPQAQRVLFERSSDGIVYTPIGEGVPGSGGTTWTLANSGFSSGYLRARALFHDASNYRSAHDFVRYFPPTVRSPFDMDGDGKTDVSIFRPVGGSGSEWWYLRSSDGGNRAFTFGLETDTIVPADFTGDGKTDVAFWRPTTGEWFVLRSEDSTFFAFPFGAAGDIPSPADFDGDGRADATVYRPSMSTWFTLRSSDGQFVATQFGVSSDKPVPS